MSGESKQGKAHPRIKIQPPLLALAHVSLAFVLTWLLPLPLAVHPTLQIAGFLIIVLGFLLGVAALIAFRRARSAMDPRSSVVHLISSGVYRFTRNPVYLGFLLILIGISLNTGSYWGILLAPLLVILFKRLVIGPEEEYLASRFGEEFKSYRSKVRRWI